MFNPLTNLNDRKMLSAFSGTVGAALLIAAPWVIDTTPGKIAAILGLAFLTIQALDKKLWNLVLLNLAGIAGYLYAIHF